MIRDTFILENPYLILPRDAVHAPILLAMYDLLDILRDRRIPVLRSVADAGNYPAEIERATAVLCAPHPLPDDFSTTVQTETPSGRFNVTRYAAGQCMPATAWYLLMRPLSWRNFNNVLPVPVRDMSYDAAMTALVMVLADRALMETTYHDRA